MDRVPAPQPRLDRAGRAGSTSSSAGTCSSTSPRPPPGGREARGSLAPGGVLDPRAGGVGRRRGARRGRDRAGGTTVLPAAPAGARAARCSAREEAARADPAPAGRSARRARERGRARRRATRRPTRRRRSPRPSAARPRQRPRDLRRRARGAARGGAPGDLRSAEQLARGGAERRPLPRGTCCSRWPPTRAATLRRDRRAPARAVPRPGLAMAHAALVPLYARLGLQEDAARARRNALEAIEGLDDGAPLRGSRPSPPARCAARSRTPPERPRAPGAEA